MPLSQILTCINLWMNCGGSLGLISRAWFSCCRDLSLTVRSNLLGSWVQKPQEGNLCHAPLFEEKNLWASGFPGLRYISSVLNLDVFLKILDSLECYPFANGTEVDQYL